jgi:transcriptional regulator with XRE-family HTH domain
MARSHKTIPAEEAKKIGASLRGERRRRGLTLTEVEHMIAVNVGQVSRFEAGKFRLLSKNLREYGNFLQISVMNFEPPEIDSLLTRLVRIAERSSGHKYALERIVEALERLE